MSAQTFTCPMCGSIFNPAEHTACNSCPLQRGCHLICCPDCGYETIDSSRSMTARLASSLFFGKRSKNDKKDHPSKEKRKMALFGLFAPHKQAAISSALIPDVQSVHNLAKVCPGEKAKISGFSKSISPERRMQLQAYGINPGTWVTVSMHVPVTVLQIEHLEIALETEMAGGIECSE